MNVLVLGCNTVNGRAIMQQFIERDHLVHGTMHGNIHEFTYISNDENAHYYGFIDAAEQPDVFDDISKLFEFAEPDVVNAVFPHVIAKMCEISDAKFIQMSNALVFSGTNSQYSEFDMPDAMTLYGKTKYIGEIENQSHVTTLRCSTFGRETITHDGIFEQLATGSGKTLYGRPNIMSNPLTAVELAKIVVDISEHHPVMPGVFNIGTRYAISEYQLMRVINDFFEFDVTIKPDYAQESLNFVLDTELFTGETGITIPSLETMVHEFCRGV
jgi:dTDP-4-dehydrorhamnose reductase